jgi:hypothetical protein
MDYAYTGLDNPWGAQTYPTGAAAADLVREGERSRQPLGRSEPDSQRVGIGPISTSGSLLTLRGVAKLLLTLGLLTGAGFAYTRSRNICVYAGVGGIGLGLTISIVSWNRRDRPQDDVERKMSPYPRISYVVSMIMVAVLAGGLGAAGIYLTQWKPKIGAGAFGLLAGFAVGLYAPRVGRLIYNDFTAPTVTIHNGATTLTLPQHR